MITPSEKKEENASTKNLHLVVHLLVWPIIWCLVYPAGTIFANSGSAGNGVWVLFYLGLFALLLSSTIATLRLIYLHLSKQKLNVISSVTFHLWLALFGLYISGVVLGYAGVSWVQ